VRCIIFHPFMRDYVRFMMNTYFESDFVYVVCDSCAAERFNTRDQLIVFQKIEV